MILLKDIPPEIVQMHTRYAFLRKPSLDKHFKVTVPPDELSESIIVKSSHSEKIRQKSCKLKITNILNLHNASNVNYSAKIAYPQNMQFLLNFQAIICFHRLGKYLVT